MFGQICIIRGRTVMTNLELVAQIGAESVDLADMYLNGHLSAGELTNILGKRRTDLILRYGEVRKAGVKIGKRRLTNRYL